MKGDAQMPERTGKSRAGRAEGSEPFERQSRELLRELRREVEVRVQQGVKLRGELDEAAALVERLTDVLNGGLAIVDEGGTRKFARVTLRRLGLGGRLRALLTGRVGAGVVEEIRVGAELGGGVESV